MLDTPLKSREIPIYCSTSVDWDGMKIMKHILSCNEVNYKEETLEDKMKTETI